MLHNFPFRIGLSDFYFQGVQVLFVSVRCLMLCYQAGIKEYFFADKFTLQKNGELKYKKSE